MSRKDLVRYYEIKMPEHLSQYAGQAIEIFSITHPGFEPFDQKNVHGIQRIALYLHERKHEGKKDKKSLMPEIESFPGSFLVAEKRIDYILPEIIQIRKELFGKTKPPFDVRCCENMCWINFQGKRK